MTSAETGKRETNIFYNINIVPVLCTWDIYVVLVGAGIWGARVGSYVFIDRM